MKWTTVLLALNCLPYMAFYQDAGGKIRGKWTNEEGKVTFETYKTGLAYSAKIIWLAGTLDNDAMPDSHNLSIIGSKGVFSSTKNFKRI